MGRRLRLQARRAGITLSERKAKALLIVAMVALSVGCVGASERGEATSLLPEPASVASDPLAVDSSNGSDSSSVAEVTAPDATSPAAVATPRVPIALSGGPAVATAPAAQAAGLEAVRGRGEATTSGATSTVEELLEDGLYGASASPVHLAIRGTPAADSVRCSWRGITRTAQQREDAIRFWLRLDATDAIPSVGALEILFSVVLDALDPPHRETAKANFLAIARGGESMDYRFLTCFADYAVTAFLLGTGTTPTTVTVAYDRRAEAASYDLYVREHDTGTYGFDPLQSRGEYEAALQAQVVAAETALSAEIGGREAVVFLAPMGAHNAIGFEAWQAVAQWAVVTDDAGVVQAVRDDTPAGDPEHTQTLANLTSRITAAADSDAFADERIETVTGLEPYYRTTLGAYGDITPGDGQTTTFTPAQPPAAPTCTNGTVIASPADNRELVKDCEALLAAKDTLRGTAALNWSTGTAMSSWTGVTTGGTPTRVTGLSLASTSMTGSIPPEIGHLLDLTTLNLKSNSLTGDVPAELGWLDHLTELRLSGNTLTGCIPLSLKSVTTNDLSSLNLPYCEPPAPSNLRAGTPGEGSLSLLWDALTGASKYHVEVWEPEGRRWRSDSDTITGTTYTVAGLECVTAYDVRVRAYGNGTTYAAAWGAPSAPLTATTGTCTPPVFDPPSYEFSVVENAEPDTPVGTVTATDTSGEPVTYAISDGNAGDVFAIDAASGAISVFGALDYAATSSYALTVTATDAAGGTATAEVTIAVTEFVIDYDADDNGLIEVADLAQLDAIRWDLDGDGVASAADHAAAYPFAPADMGCPATGCTGYELMADLDLDTDGSGTVDAADAYWHEGAGWAPLGDSTTGFTATFNGNGHAIENLFINRGTTDYVGLFGKTGTGSEVRQVGLPDVAVTGQSYVGGLVGWNEGSVTSSHAGGQVTGTSIDTGGLVGWSTHRITTSYATAAVTGGGLDAGGLVGGNGQNARISASYAGGAVTGAGRAGGLAGFNAGRITNSYARGAVTGAAPTGGLVALSTRPATASYWDTTASGQATSATGTGQATSDLQTPTDASGIYATWSDAWDFGTASQYPVLMVDFDGDGTASWEEFGEQRPAAAVNQPPVFVDGPTATRMVAEHTAAGEAIGDPLSATDADDDPLTYTLGGADAASFELDSGTGQLQVLAALDYETRATYAVTAEVSDGAGGTATIAVTIEVTDVADTPPPAPTNLTVTPAATSLALAWDAVAGAATYRVESRVADTDPWTTDGDTLTTLTHTLPDLTCGTAYEVRVSAYGDGVAHRAAWGEPSAALATATMACPPPVFVGGPFSFTISERAGLGAAVGPVTATTTGAGPVTYAIAAGNDTGAFAIDGASGQLTVAASLDAAVVDTYDLTVEATAGGASATTPVTITLTAEALTPPPPPANLAVTAGLTSLALSWDALPGASHYAVDYLPPNAKVWMVATETLTASAFSLPDLRCGTVYQVRVSAYGDGITHAAAWGEPTSLPTATAACAPAFDAESYSFTIGGSAGVGTPVGTVTAMPAEGGALTYAITAGHEAGAFALDGANGQLTVAGALDAASYALTVSATEADGGTATVAVTISVTATPAAVTVAFGQAAYATSEGAASGVTVTVSLSADPEREITIPLTVTLQNGAEAADYSGVPASLTFAAGATSATFDVVAVDDALDDDGESLGLGFGTLPAGVTAGAVATTTVSLTDNDEPPAVTVAFGQATYATSEGAASGVTVTVMLSADPQREVTILLTATPQGGAEAADFSGVPASLTFAAGATSATFVVVAVDDGLDDDGESLSLGFGTLPAGVTVGSEATTTVSLTDNDEPPAGDTEVWTATLTVGGTGGSLGYVSAGSSAGGALGDTTFDWQGASYTVWNLSYASYGRLNAILDTPASDDSLAGLTLHLGDVALAVADAQVYGGPQLIWDDITLDWAADDTVTVRLTAPASDTSSGS